jgi:hypothetical protein
MKALAINIKIDSSGLPAKKPGLAVESAFPINDVGGINA